MISAGDELPHFAMTNTDQGYAEASWNLKDDYVSHLLPSDKDPVQTQ